MKPFWRSLIPCAALIVLLTVVAYIPASNGGFVWDDDSWTSNISGLLGDFSGLRLMWCQPTALQQYYPLSGTTFWLDHHLWGSWTLPYHMENVLLHALAALLFWRLLRRLQVPGAWLAGALFALHPVMVESVAWITERKNVLSLVLYLGSLLAYGRFVLFWRQDNNTEAAAANAPPRRWSVYALALLLALGALLAKTTAFSLPAVLLLVCWWKRGRIRWRVDVVPTLPFFALAIGLSLMTAWLEKNHIGAQGVDFAIAFPERCLIAGRATWFYIGKLLWPANLCFIYPRWQLNAGSFWEWLYPVTAVSTLVLLWLARRRMGRGPAAAAFYFVGTLFPVLGFLNAYGMRYSFVWDHWVYLPSLALFAVVAALVARAADHLRAPLVLPGFAVAALFALLILTWRQSGMYTDMETLWRTTIARDPNAFLAYNNLGTALSGTGREEEAIAYFTRALEIKTNFYEAHNNLGDALMRAGRLNQALEHFEKAVEIAPGFPDSQYNLGNALRQAGRLDEAMDHFERALKLRPNFAKAHNNLGVALMSIGHPNEAMIHFQQALEANPRDADANDNLGGVFALQGRLEEAVAQYRKSIQIQPGHADAHANLANVLVAQGRLNEAIQEYQRVLALMPASAQTYYKLGLALQSQGKFEPAMAQYQKVLELEPRHALAANNLAWLLAACPEASLRNGSKAIELARQAEQLSGSQHPEILDTLAAAYAEAGRFPEAVETAQRALQLAGAQSNTALADAIHARLKLYEGNSPYREKP